MISIDEAKRHILADIEPLPEELETLTGAWNRVLARSVHARTGNPPADVSAMDGYAVRSAELVPGTPLRLLGEGAAGHPFGGAVTPGTCVRIFTGSVIPTGSDAVLVQEDAERRGEDVVPARTVTPNRHIRRRNADFAPGSVLVAGGRRLGARDIGLLAADGHAWVPVRRVPRVLVVTTGDELVLPGEPAAPGRIHNSNAPMLAALVRAAGAEPVLLPPVPDDRDAIRRAIAGSAGVDVVVTVGGVSVGDHDLVRTVLDGIGFRTAFWRIAMRPGKPLLFGTLPTGSAPLPLLGLPGNPVSAMVCSLRFLLPALRRLGGETADADRPDTARLAAPLPANDHRADHLRATLEPGDDAPLAMPLPRQDSGMLRDLAVADALILREPHAPALPPGAAVPIIRLDRFGI